MTTQKPAPGMHITARGETWIIYRVYASGTLDAVSLDGERAVRITGLPFL